MNQTSPFLAILFVLISYTLLFSSCANRIPPSGGPKDEAPPIVEKIVPENLTTQFSAETIRIQFDEYFTLDDPFNQIVISPPLPNRPKYRIRGKALLVELNNELESNTTYTVNFGDAIKDFNERNTLKNFSYVFSTGLWLDSLQVTGKIYLAKDNSTEENILALLYKDLSDTAFYAGNPFYFSKTDKNGNFKISNIGKGEYQVYALKDNNLNYQYDSKEELVGFIDDPIQVLDTGKNHLIVPIFRELTDRVKLLESYANVTGSYRFVFNTAVNTVSLDTELFKDGDFAYLSEEKDTLTFWTSNYSAEQAIFYLTINDTLKDTVELAPEAIEQDSINLPQYQLGFHKSKQVKGKSRPAAQKKNLYESIEIKFDRPLVMTDFNKIQLLEDSLKTKVEGSYRLDPKTKSILILDYQWVSGASYQLVLPDSTFQDLFGLFNKQLQYNFEMEDKEKYGNIKLNVINPREGQAYIFEIYNSKNHLLARQSFTSNTANVIEFTNYLAGNYTIRVFEDDNRNGVWDTGNLRERKQAETTVNYSKNVSLKANWEMELDVKLQK